MSPSHIALWTIAVGCVCGVACALVGCFLMLRRMSMMGDALSHGILPGIALAVLLTHTVSSLAIFLGAMVFGLVTAALAQALQKLGKTTEDAALGIVFTSLFAVGVILISNAGTHLDDCIFYGQFEFVPMDVIDVIPGVEIPRTLPMMLVALAAVVVFITLLWKELQLATFDPELATAMGFRASLIQYLLIALVAGVTVTAFEAFGAILVLAFLIVPAATAHLLTDRLLPLLLVAAALTVLAVGGGFFLAKYSLGANIGGTMAAVLGGLFAAAVLFGPRHGVVARIWRRRQLALRIAREEILAGLFRQEEGKAVTWREDLRAHGLSPAIERRALRRLCDEGLIAQTAEGTLLLTEAGRQAAQSIVRSHRLWETFLGQYFELPPDHLHEPASRVEHFIGPQLQQELAAQLDKPAVDPHGRSIPTAGPES